MSSKKLSNYLKKIIPLVVLLALGHVLQAQQMQITGQVNSDNGEKLPGVSVQIEGTTVGTVTDMDGNFSITVPGKESVLVFTYVGFLTERRTVGTGTVMKVLMITDLKNLDEVVVVGYGSQRKRDITGAITSVSEKSIEQRQAVNIYDALQGMAPGLQISSESGAPGASTSIMLRGASTFDDAGVSPLFIVDGVIAKDIDNINPKDIKSVEVLKDAASSAIYGARSANGVIIITTKSGEAGVPKVEFRYLRSYSSIANKIPQVNAFEQVLNDPSTRGAVLEKYRANSDSVGLINSTNYFYQDFLTQTAVRNDYNLSVSGGTDKVRFMGSLGYIGNEGVILTSFNNKFTGRFNIDFQATKKLKSITRISFGKSSTNKIDQGNVFQTAMRRPPNMIIWYPDGTFAPYYAMGGNRNPVQELYAREMNDSRYQGTIYQALEYKFNPSLSLMTSATADLDLQRYTEFNSKELDSNGDENLRKNSGEDQTGWGQNYQADAYLTFNKTFNKDHTLNLMAGSSVETDRSDDLNFQASYFVSEEIYTMNQGILEVGSNTTATEFAMAGFFGRAGYSYKGRYIFNSNLRYDGSSRFGQNQKWGFFPSASLGWRFSDESFMQWASGVLDDGKLRASWGITGNDRVGNYESQLRYTAGVFYNGITGVYPVGTYGNPDLHWEETQQTNFGLDLSFANSRINFIADYYIKETKDLLSDMNLTYLTGFDKMRVNLASIENKGVELSLTVVPVRSQKVNWQTTINWWTNRNKITKLAKDDYIQSSTYMVAEGQPAGLFFGYRNLGIYQYDVSNAYAEDYKTRLNPVLQRDNNGNVIIGLDGQPTLLYYTLPNGETYNGTVTQLTSQGVVAKGGDVIWENMPDRNGVYDNKIDDNDRTILGEARPDWSASWSNTVSYKNFTLSFNFYTNWGGLVYNKLKRYYTSWGGNTHMQNPEYIRTGWKYQGQITDWYAINTRDRKTNNRAELSDYYLEDASFIRLKNLRVAYKVSTKFLDKLSIKDLNIYLYANNLATWTNYSGFDPEIGGGVLTPGTDNSAYPRNRELGFGVNLTF